MTVKICDCEGECCKDSCHCGSTCLPSCSGGEKCKCDHSTGSPQCKSCGENANAKPRALVKRVNAIVKNVR